jgi:hypothetical protein
MIMLIAEDVVVASFTIEITKLFSSDQLWLLDMYINRNSLAVAYAILNHSLTLQLIMSLGFNFENFTQFEKRVTEKKARDTVF